MADIEQGASTAPRRDRALGAGDAKRRRLDRREVEANRRRPPSRVPARRTRFNNAGVGSGEA